MSPLATTLRARFDAKYFIEPNTGCWLWEAAADVHGYGYIGYKRRGQVRAAHRVAWELYRGGEPGELDVCHKCDTPSCVNPGHLFLGDAQANVSDMLAKGRWTRPVKLTAEQVAEIRASPLPQHELAKKFGVNQSNISRLKSGTRWTEHGQKRRPLCR